MNITSRCRRQPDVPAATTLEEYVALMDQRLASGDRLGALDIVAALLPRHPDRSGELLSRACGIFRALETGSRYELYQERLFDFPIRPGDRVLDIGSGHLPFPLATHLADIAIADGRYGRAGLSFRDVEGKPVYEVPLEDTGFADKEFDFVYCSHVLEHSTDPAKACDELMRIGKRGYIETPSPAKDFFLQTAGISNHLWGVEVRQDVLEIRGYSEFDISGIGSDVLLRMCCDPVTEREKEFYSLIYLYADRMNTMFMWEGGFKYSVRRNPAGLNSAG